MIQNIQLRSGVVDLNKLETPTLQEPKVNKKGCRSPILSHSAKLKEKVHTLLV